MSEDSTNVNFVWISFLDLLLHLCCISKRLVSYIDIIFQSERKLSLGKI